MSERERIEAVIWHFLREAEPEWESGKCAIYAEDLAGRIMPLLRAEPVGEPWRPIETAPKDGTTVIVARDMHEWGWVLGHARWESARNDFSISGWISHGFTNPPGELGLAAPTHWMPLPSAPTEGGEPERCDHDMDNWGTFTTCRKCGAVWLSGNLTVGSAPVSAVGEEEK